MLQQWRALQTLGEAPHPNPSRAAFLHNLALFIETKQSKGDKIQLQLNANTVRDNDELSNFLTALHLVDLHCIVSSGPFSQSFASGSIKIDYMLGTLKVAAAVRFGGILNFEQGLTSDHRGMYLDLEESSLFSSKMQIQLAPWHDNCASAMSKPPRNISKFYMNNWNII